jgi:hypothetical protein
MRPIVTLTTDFGIRDSYVGVMKGVILSICPTAHLVDITHAITPQNVVEAAFIVQSFVPYFPVGTVHLVVVDPGVGSPRRAIALTTPRARYVGPDNGVLGPVWQDARTRWTPAEVRTVELTVPRFWRPQVSTTFHGRDIFAPVAAHLAAGIPLRAFGPALDTIEVASLPEPVREPDGSLRGSIIYVDHFGNCVSNITVAHLDWLGPQHQELEVTVGEHSVGTIQRTYADVAPGMPLALPGSNGRLELAVRNGHASQTLGVAAGDIVRVRRVG